MFCAHIILRCVCEFGLHRCNVRANPVCSSVLLFFVINRIVRKSANKNE